MTTQGRPRTSSPDRKVPSPSQHPGQPANVEHLQARIKELERQLKNRSSVAEHSRGAAQLQPVAIGLLGAVVVITTPLAFLTVKRWWHWWVD